MPDGSAARRPWPAASFFLSLFRAISLTSRLAQGRVEAQEKPELSGLHRQRRGAIGEEVAC
jgi:hypothetical protein